MLVFPDDFYDGFAALAEGAFDLVVNDAVHLVDRLELILTSHGQAFAASALITCGTFSDTRNL